MEAESLYRVLEIPPRDRMLSQMNPVHILEH
jgi:hypothetical protein